MKLAILADIHGNSWALHSVLADIKEKGINNRGSFYYKKGR